MNPLHDIDDHEDDDHEGEGDVVGICDNCDSDIWTNDEYFVNGDTLCGECYWAIYHDQEEAT